MDILEALDNKQWEETGATIDGSPIYVVNYGDDERVRFWNNGNNTPIDCDEACTAIAHVIRDNGWDIEDNVLQLEHGWNTIEFEIFDNNY